MSKIRIQGARLEPYPHLRGSAGQPMDALLDGAKTVQNLVAWEPSRSQPLTGKHLDSLLEPSMKLLVDGSKLDRPGEKMRGSSWAKRNLQGLNPQPSP
ncbi:hypothetical protein PCANC_18173 [Puccinia coronata f. sp. avenae]|uniref:Uncharacterized protein n=1 Tax=Puccinia coronata f. sp. avenae TaxID=200324 RepID=A0A2N5SNQ8_9BASI|nr:hypothetical protein PCANC_18173 [Puccinia coronata f. sp. avenae]